MGIVETLESIKEIPQQFQLDYSMGEIFAVSGIVLGAFSIYYLSKMAYENMKRPFDEEHWRNNMSNKGQGRNYWGHGDFEDNNYKE